MTRGHTRGTLPTMDVVKIEHEGLGNTSYLVEVAPGKALAVDADRRVSRYLDAAAEHGWEFVAVADTHLHADFVTGSLELRERTGAVQLMPESAGAAFPHRGVVPGERIEVGDSEIEVLATPGHAPEHVSFVLRRGSGEPPMLFSGGALIAGGAARSDLVAPDLTERLTRAQFHTLHEAFRDLPDATLLMPTHGGGSFCSVGGDGAEATTVGAERAANPLLAMADEEEFVRWWPSTFPAAPAYFFRMRAINVAGPRSLADVVQPLPMSPAAFEEAVADGALILDVRRAKDYAAAHVPGSLSIQFRDAFATWLGWIVPPDVALVFVADGVPLARVVEESLLVGYERFAGWLEGGLDVWRESGRPVAALDLVDVEGAADLLEQGALPLDVREPDEFALGHLAGAELVPLGSLEERLPGLSMDRPILTYCASGQRSTTAASILERHGARRVANLRGGYGAWQDAVRD